MEIYVLARKKVYFNTKDLKVYLYSSTSLIWNVWTENNMIFWKNTYGCKNSSIDCFKTTSDITTGKTKPKSKSANY